MPYYGVFNNAVVRFPNRRERADGHMDDRISGYSAVVDKRGYLKITHCIKATDFETPRTNPEALKDVLDFIADNKIVSITPRTFVAKVAMDYTVETMNGEVFRGGCAVIPVDTMIVPILMEMGDECDLNYRVAINSHVTFDIGRFRPAPDVTIRTPHLAQNPLRLHGGEVQQPLVFKISNVSVMMDSISSGDIHPSMINATLPLSSKTLCDLRENSTCVFDAVRSGLSFSYYQVPAECSNITVNFSISIPICQVKSDEKIFDAVVENRRGLLPGVDDGTPGGSIYEDPFGPIVCRPPCPGRLPHDTNTYWEGSVVPGSGGNSSWNIFPGSGPHCSDIVRLDPDNITSKNLPGLYSITGHMTASWDKLISQGRVVNNKGILEIPRGGKPLDGILVISPDILSIGPGAFFGNKYVTSVFIPTSITTIHEAAFYCCNSLEKVFFPANLQSICDSAFMGCEMLVKADLPEGIALIGKNAFSHCKLLTVTVPTTVSVVGEYAFDEVFKVTYLGELPIDGWGMLNAEVLSKEPEPESPEVVEGSAGSESTVEDNTPADVDQI